MGIPFVFIVGFILYVIMRVVVKGFYVVQQNERSVKTIFGRAECLDGVTTIDIPDFVPY